MDRPSTSRDAVEKVEMYEVREHVPYQPELTRAPTTYDEESGQGYNNSWMSAWKAICQLFNLLQHMQIAIVVFSLWHFALNSSPNGNFGNLQMHIIYAGTGYQLFLVEAVLTLHRHNSWSSNLSPDGKRIVHGSLQVIGALFVIAGTFLALAEVEMTISTAHGVCGVIALAFTIVSFVSGVITLFSSKVRLMVKSGPVRVLHLAIGLFAVSMGLITMTIGFNMDYFSATQGGLSVALSVFSMTILAYVLIQPIYGLISSTRNKM